MNMVTRKSDTPEDVEEPVIPTHSHLTMAWVESGILGGVFWIYVLGLTFRCDHEGQLHPSRHWRQSTPTSC